MKRKFKIDVQAIIAVTVLLLLIFYAFKFVPR
jgi:hypothetical protein